MAKIKIDWAAVWQVAKPYILNLLSALGGAGVVTICK